MLKPGKAGEWLGLFGPAWPIFFFEIPGQAKAVNQGLALWLARPCVAAFLSLSYTVDIEPLIRTQSTRFESHPFQPSILF